MLTSLPGLTLEDLVEACKNDRCLDSPDDFKIFADFIPRLNHELEQLCKNAGAQVESLRIAQVLCAATIVADSHRFIAPENFGYNVAFSLAEQWLAKCDALMQSRVAEAWTAFKRRVSEPDLDLVDAARVAMGQVVADPMTVFVAGPITGAAPEETEALVTISGDLREGLVQLRVRLYSAPEQADPRVHRDFADDERWRDHDEHWIRRCDLVVILHPRAATGLGSVHEIARSACVPVLVVADDAVSPMVARAVTPERLLESNNVVEKVVEYIAAHGHQMAQRRRDVRAEAQKTWRPGRIRLQRDIAALTDEALTEWTPSTITRERLMEVVADDYAYGSLTDFERLQLRQAFSLPKLRALRDVERRALEQAKRNNHWTDEVAWYVELSGRELLAMGDGEERHLARSHDPAFWEQVHGGLDT